MKSGYYFLIIAGIIASSGCSKNDLDEAIPSNSYNDTFSSINIDSPWQYSMMIDGTVYSKEYSPSDILVVNTSLWELSSNASDTITRSYVSEIYRYDPYTLYFAILRNVRLNEGEIIADPDFLQLFDRGTYKISKPDFNGFSINWTDDNGVVWGTDRGEADQSNSTLVIERVRISTDWWSYSVRILCHFNCRLYDGFGNSKTVTNGKYVGEFSSYN